MPDPSSIVLEPIIIQHREEAAFLWLLRDAAVHAPHYSLPDLAELDDRVEAHLDGLRIAGEAGWEICKEELSWEEAGEVFVTAVMALESGLDERYEAVLEAASASVEQSRGFISALGWLPYTQAQPYVNRLLAAESATLRRIGMAAAAIHRQDPRHYLKEALTDEDPLLRARALKAVGELGRRDLAQVVRHAMQDEEEACRFWAAWSAALLGDLYASQILRPIAEQGGVYAERACGMALRTMRLSDAHAWQQQLAERPEHHRLAVFGAGVIGDPTLVPWLIEQMEIPEFARVAGEAFTMITGVDLAYDDLEGEWPEGFEAGPTEDPEDENVEMDADEDLPWPEPELIQEWWNGHQGAFRAGTRYLLGQPIEEASLQTALRNGTQRQRAAAALELAIMKPGSPLFEVRAPGFRQLQMLAAR